MYDMIVRIITTVIEQGNGAMRCTYGMGENLSVWAQFGQFAGASCVIQVNMCDDDVVHIFGLKTLRFQGLHHCGDTTTRVVVDERSVAPIPHQIRRGIVWPLHVVAIDGCDSFQVLSRSGIAT